MTEPICQTSQCMSLYRVILTPPFPFPLGRELSHIHRYASTCHVDEKNERGGRVLRTVIRLDAAAISKVHVCTVSVHTKRAILR